MKSAAVESATERLKDTSMNWVLKFCRERMVTATLSLHPAVAARLSSINRMNGRR